VAAASSPLTTGAVVLAAVTPTAAKAMTEPANATNALFLMLTPLADGKEEGPGKTGV
jgi:hypothetical protein